MCVEIRRVFFYLSEVLDAGDGHFLPLTARFRGFAGSYLLQQGDDIQ